MTPCWLTLALHLGLAASISNANHACHALEKAVPGSVAVPGSAAYLEAGRYWSERQAELRPSCFFIPADTQEVSRGMKVLTGLDTPFSVKSGGHTAFEGGSSSDAGVTIDLVRLNGIVVSEDRRTVSVGPGNRWINVSRTLDPLGLAVVGGRECDVGVGGLVLGGGISYFSGRHGWACDNVGEFEVVLSSGRAVNASASENPDLYRALRGGGGSNWGIVTRFDLVAFEQGALWASSLIFPASSNGTLVSRFRELAVDGLATDPDAHAYMVFMRNPTLGRDVVLASFYHATVPGGGGVPDVFAPFQSVRGALVNTTVVAGVSTLSESIREPYGSRQTWWDTSVRLGAGSARLLEDILPLFEALSEKLRSALGSDDVRTLLVFQPILTNVLRQMQKNGGNALGLHPDDGPLMIVQLAIKWDDDLVDDLVEASSAEFISSVESMAKSRQLLKGYVYMNYAGRSQHVLERYGEQSYRRLKETANKWDPEGLLQKLWKGYFKIDGE
ncbi:hypothetical protein RJ55_02067 [Drechmeria coniospora]|nr:hypothetical protein RJ55_02067 [Drechmeria coniospora]